MKKFTAFLLAICFLFSMILPVYAAELEEVEETATAALIQEEAARIMTAIPGAVVRIKDNAIHVAVNSPEQIPNFVSNARTTSVISSTGGSYRNFIIPAFADFSPYSQVYMSRDVTKGVEFRFDNPDAATRAIQMIADGVAYVVIATYVKSAIESSGLNNDDYETVSDEEVDQIIEGLRYLVYVGIIDLEHTVFDSALRSSTTGKVSVLRGLNINGYNQYFYYPWNDNVCSTFGGYNATWFAGIYDIAGA